MVELNQAKSEPLPVVSCCAAEKQTDCCAASEKAKCCPPGATGCGCQASTKD